MMWGKMLNDSGKWHGKLEAWGAAWGQNTEHEIVAGEHHPSLGRTRNPEATVSLP